MEQDKEKNVILITEDSLQSSLLKDVLESKLNIVVNLVAPERLNQFSEEDFHNPYALVIDHTIVNEEFFANYSEFKGTFESSIREVIINCDPHTSPKQLFSWRHLAGIFYTSSDIEALQRGIGKILEGDMWFSRGFSQEYISYLRTHSRPVSNMVSTVLTKREKQIITYLSEGASNQQIAEKLFVSENTVKTHLHNIFKKIDVKNRVQALIWAKDNIFPSSQPI